MGMSWKEWNGVVGTHGRFDEFSFDEFEKACMEDLVNCVFGWKVDVLDDVRSVDERGVYNADTEMRVGKMEWRVIL